MKCTYFFEISYDGTNFFGWQNQPGQKSVQGTIEEVLTKLHSNEEVSIAGCGRTDTGVHAKSYVFHAVIPEVKSLDLLKYKLNKMLPESIAVHKITKVSDDSHARFNAKWRTYRYFIHFQKNPFKARFSTYLKAMPDIEKMNEVCAFLIGTHDFTTFSKVNSSVKSHDCEVKKAIWVKTDDDEIYFEITANRFLRNMVRSLVGTSLDLGNGIINSSQFKEFLEAKDRSKSLASAPAEGLFLWEIKY